MTKILVTGCSGMIGFHLLKALSNYEQFQLYGIDKNISTPSVYNYAVERNNALRQTNRSIVLEQLDLSHPDCVEKLATICPDIIVHLAASAGIADSFKFPDIVLNNNHSSFLNILEFKRKYQPHTKLLYASSSSVYGISPQPSIENNILLQPTSSYGLSKLMNEQLAQLYSNNYNIGSIGLRFFTVYGEYNRKDMLMHYLLDSFCKDKQVVLYNNGLMQRDFTYVKDVVNCIIALFEQPQTQHNLYNIGGTGSATLNSVVDIMQSHFKNPPNIIKQDFIPVYDPLKTFCNNTKLLNEYPHLQFTPLEKGLYNLVQWYKEFYSIEKT